MRRRVFRVATRASFAALEASSRQARSGPVAVRFVPDETTDRVCVAYAIGRRFGGAVDRNHCRRRLRAVVRELVAEMPAGAYLIGIGPGAAGLAFRELRERVFEAVRRASAGADRGVNR